MRAPNLGEVTDNYDEGVYLESLLLMRFGYRPFVDIIATQGPLHLDIAYISYGLGGHTLTAARLGPVVASVAGVAGIAWAAYALIGRLGGVGAALALSLSPTYLTVSRQTLPEAPAIAFAVLGLAAAAWAHRTDRHRWRVLAGVLPALACLMKPVVGPVVLPILTLAVQRRSWRGSFIAPLTAVLVQVGVRMS